MAPEPQVATTGLLKSTPRASKAARISGKLLKLPAGLSPRSKLVNGTFSAPAKRCCLAGARDDEIGE